ncbi:hypothetical protein [Rhizobium sp. MHM7A]|uniref:hypothetical protein n=1 Tax=Rhizobium sp. MHM7A TaxID=2583233 RepID=UPI0011057F25|nr:hypothetical protein [Rhizobium sp. MHM7A]TLX16419.1 hypothetical protein FFR93_03540 [Rhizobium sp. MHM7A]
MVDFKNLMTPLQRAYYERVDVEIARLFNLPTRFLARALMRHARNARARHPDFLALNPREGNKTISTLVWDIIPEISYRMGERSEIPGERQRHIRAMTDAQFRIHAGYVIMSCANIILNDEKRIRDPNDVDPIEVLTHDVANGNPVAFALDRVVPAHSFNKEDVLSRYTQEVSENRGFQPPYLMWEPDMQNYRHLQGGLAFGL